MSDYTNAAAPEEMEGLEAEAIEAEFVPEDGEGPDAEQAQGLGSDACSALAGTVFELIAMRRGDLWRLKTDESQAIGGALDAVLQKYAPGVGDIGAEASLLLITLSLVVPRIQADQGGDDEA